jgi:hypothetical protein
VMGSMAVSVVPCWLLYFSDTAINHGGSKWQVFAIGQQAVGSPERPMYG